MRAILESYDSELTPAEHSPQLSRRMREAEDMAQKLHAHNTELEVIKQHPALTPEVKELRPPRLNCLVMGSALAEARFAMFVLRNSRINKSHELLFCS